jgi:hypothetical protein
VEVLTCRAATRLQWLADLPEGKAIRISAGVCPVTVRIEMAASKNEEFMPQLDKQTTNLINTLIAVLRMRLERIEKRILILNRLLASSAKEPRCSQIRRGSLAARSRTNSEHPFQYRVHHRALAAAAQGARCGRLTVWRRVFANDAAVFLHSISPAGSNRDTPLRISGLRIAASAAQISSLLPFLLILSGAGQLHACED